MLSAAVEAKPSLLCAAAGLLFAHPRSSALQAVVLSVVRDVCSVGGCVAAPQTLQTPRALCSRPPRERTLRPPSPRHPFPRRYKPLRLSLLSEPVASQLADAALASADATGDERCLRGELLELAAALTSCARGDLLSKDGDKALAQRIAAHPRWAELEVAPARHRRTSCAHRRRHPPHPRPHPSPAPSAAP